MNARYQKYCGFAFLALGAALLPATVAKATIFVSNANVVSTSGVGTGLPDAGIISNDIDPVSGPPPVSPTFAADTFTGFSDLLNSPGTQGGTSFNSLTVSPANNLAPAPAVLTIPSPGYIYRNQPAGGLFGGASTIVNNKGGAWFSLGDAGVGSTVSSTYASWTTTYQADAGGYVGNFDTVMSYSGTLPLGGAFAMSGTTYYVALGGTYIAMPPIVLGVTDTGGVGGTVLYANNVAGASQYAKAVFTPAGGGALNFKVIGIDIVSGYATANAHFTAWNAIAVHADPDATGSSIDLSDWSMSDLSGLTLPDPSDQILAQTDDESDVPEPVSLGLIGVAAAFGLLRRRSV
jgi:hypothetical protein